MVETTFSKVLFENKEIPFYQIKNNFGWWGYSGIIKVKFPYKLVDTPDYYVSDNDLYLTKNASVDEVDKHLILESIEDFRVNGNTLIIKNN